MLRKIFILSLGMVCFNPFTMANAQNKISLSKKPTVQQKEEMLSHNMGVLQSGDLLSSNSTPGLFVQRPVAEYEDTGYLIFYDVTDFASADIKAKLIENLPTDVTAIIYTDSNDQTELEGLYRYYSKLAPSAGQVKIISIDNAPKSQTFEGEDAGFVQGNGFWSRDGIPVPVIQMANLSPLQALSEKFTVVDARYYHFYEPDEVIADYFNAGLLAHNFYFEGGNFIVNAKGDCIIVDKAATQIIPSSIFTKTYGCSTLVRLPHVKGIGHADESVKFVSDDHILTDDAGYKKTLEARGFKVTLLPRPKREYETYVNSLIINGTVWVPIFKQKTDKEALDVYHSLGLNVIPADSSILSNEGAGSIHCITMTYPKTTEFNEVLAYFGAKNVVGNANVNRGVERVVKSLEDERQEHIDRLKDPKLEKYLDRINGGWF